MSSRRHIKKTEEKTDINISPMIDMVFILLIFFIVTTVFVEEEGIDIDKPTPQTDQQDDDDRDPVILRISSTNQVSHDGEVISLNRVESIVRNALSRETVPIILQVERGAMSGIMIQVMDRAKVGGAEIISVSAAN
jgi:biopolymer transport protein ExbD